MSAKEGSPRRPSDPLARLDAKLGRLQPKGRSGSLSTQQRLEELESGLGRVALLARALAELCLEKRVLTLAELERVLEQVDLADGVRDGRLEPDVALPGEHRIAPLRGRRAADDEPEPPAAPRRRRRPAR